MIAVAAHISTASGAKIGRKAIYSPRCGADFCTHDMSTPPSCYTNLSLEAQIGVLAYYNAMPKLLQFEITDSHLITAVAVGV